MKIMKTEAWPQVPQVQFVIKKYKDSLWKSMVLVQIRTGTHICIKMLNLLAWLAWLGWPNRSGR